MGERVVKTDIQTAAVQGPSQSGSRHHEESVSILPTDNRSIHPLVIAPRLYRPSTLRCEGNEERRVALQSWRQRCETNIRTQIVNNRSSKVGRVMRRTEASTIRVLRTLIGSFQSPPRIFRVQRAHDVCEVAAEPGGVPIGVGRDQGPDAIVDFLSGVRIDQCFAHGNDPAHYAACIYFVQFNFQLFGHSDSICRAGADSVLVRSGMNSTVDHFVSRLNFS